MMHRLNDEWVLAEPRLARRGGRCDWHPACRAPRASAIAAWGEPSCDLLRATVLCAIGSDVYFALAQLFGIRELLTFEQVHAALNAWIAHQCESREHTGLDAMLWLR
jgi:hypothetical protein